MLDSVLVAASPDVVDAVRMALPELNVRPAPDLSQEQTIWESQCLFIGPETGDLTESPILRGRNVPVVKLIADGTRPATLAAHEPPSAHVGSEAEIRLALQLALLQHRVERLLAELSGPWSHDARGALGVVRLALELLRSNGDAASSIQKIENGSTRLGWLIERLPAQLALATNLPLPERPPATLFPSLQAYVSHLGLVHSRRPIELEAGEWASTSASQALVPFAAGFAEFAFKVSPARAKVRFSATAEDGLEVECECPQRPDPWNIQTTLDALDLTRSGDASVPYRLTEAARLAIRSKAHFSLVFDGKGFVGSARLDEQADG